MTQKPCVSLTGVFARVDIAEVEATRDTGLEVETEDFLCETGLYVVEPGELLLSLTVLSDLKQSPSRPSWPKEPGIEFAASTACFSTVRVPTVTVSVQTTPLAPEPPT